MELASRSAVVDEIVAAARHRSTSADYPGSYIDRVRAATARMAAVEVRPDDMRTALLLLEQQTEIDVVVPVSSSHRSMGVLKKVLRKLMLFYVRYVGHQVTLMGQATVRFGTAVTERVERLEEQVSADERRRDAEVQSLAERVSRLEGAVGQAESAGR